MKITRILSWEDISILIQVSNNYTGNRRLLVEDTLYSFTPNGLLLEKEPAILAGAKLNVPYKPCCVISILVSKNCDYVELATFTHDNKKLDTRIMDNKEYEKIKLELKRKNLWYFMEKLDFMHDRLVYIYE